MRLPAATLLATALGACDGCGASTSLQVRGATPYVRCLAASSPAEGSRQVGAVRIESREGDLRIAGLHPPVTLAAFSGPAFDALRREPQLDALRAAAPQLLLVLGGIGDTPEVAKATLAALADLDLPTLILAGGRDSRNRIDAALSSLRPDSAARIIDVTGARSVSIGDDMLVPVAGSFEGRYALADDGCGYASSDLGPIADALPAARGRRWLLAWEAPAGGGEAAVARTDDGIDVGSAALAELARDIGAAGGLFAWPHVQVLRPSATGDHRRAVIGGASERDLRLVVPRLTGPAMERSDGSLVAPGFALLELGAKGMRVAAVHGAQ